MSNPHYSHQCIIYRLEGANSFSKGERKEIYSGICRKSSSTNIRSFNTGSNATGKVDIADYRVSMPGIVKGIKKGDFIDVSNLIYTEKEMRIVNVETTLLEESGTAVLCNTSSN